MALGLPIFFGLSIPTLLIACYPLFGIVANDNPSWLVGYRTRRALANRENWRVAQNMAGRYTWWIGVLWLVIGLFAFGYLIAIGNCNSDQWSRLGPLFWVWDCSRRLTWLFAGFG